MQKFAGYIIRDEDSKYLNVFFTSKKEAEKFCMEHRLNSVTIKQVYVNE